VLKSCSFSRSNKIKLHFIYKQEVISFNIDRARRLTAAMLLERRFSVGYRNARAKAENSSNSGEAYHFESLARQYAWDLFTLQRQGVTAAVQQANHSLPLTTTIIIMVVVVKLDLPVFLFLILLALSTVKKTETKRGQS
jgi:hypothetical protein